MSDEILKALDNCLARLSQGDTVEQCLADYPQHRAQLEPLLRTAQTVSSAPGVFPSDEFRQTSPARLVARLRSESRDANRSRRRLPGLSGLGHILLARPLVPISVAIVAAIVMVLLSPLLSSGHVYAQEYNLNILKGSAEIKRAGSSDWEPAVEGVSLKAGSQVRTAAGSYALLTFFDGSTTKLEPGTEVAVSRSEYFERQLVRIELEQRSGGTWNHVQTWDGDTPYFAVQTPRMKVVAQGTSFRTEIEESGHTTLSVTEGSVDIIGPYNVKRLVAGQRVEAGTGATTPVVTAIPPARNELIVSTALPGVASVGDPSGSSTGYLPEGLALNQITGSKAALFPDRQRITVDEPVPGEYAITVRSISGDPISVNIQVRSGDTTVFEHNETLQGAAGQVWVSRIKLDPAKDASVSGDFLSTQPLVGKAPETVVKTDLATENSVPIGRASPAGQVPDVTPSPSPIATPTPSPTRMPVISPKPDATAAPTRPADPTPAPNIILTPRSPEPTPEPAPEPGTTPPPDIGRTPLPEPTPAPDTSLTPAPRPTPTPTPKPLRTTPAPEDTTGDTGAVSPVEPAPGPAPVPTPTPTPAPVEPKPLADSGTTAETPTRQSLR